MKKQFQSLDNSLFQPIQLNEIQKLRGGIYISKQKTYEVTTKKGSGEDNQDSNTVED
ncbi:hypothetical protein [Chitinophaga polysaccharea]|uniref:hypothetical protein n=1 Tax=Chitinophaga polysaccharea TaxID=1293035 RepID=UPI00163CECE4|nr:hypothetical protein [Chitinophaga polysaccharea]